MTKNISREVDWVRVSSKPGELSYCARCGEGLNIPLPQRVEGAVAAMKAFAGAHSRCRPGQEHIQSNISPQEWLDGRDTGTSSLSIFSAINGYPLSAEQFDIPHDPDDFGRCYRLLNLVPSYRMQLSKVSAECPAWKPFVDAWDELASLYEEESPSGRAPNLYSRMMDCERAGKAAGPSKRGDKRG